MSHIDISIIVPLLDESESIPELENWIREVMQREQFTYEIIFVDDGSTDNSWEIIEDLKSHNPNVRGIKFRRNYGKSAALNEAFKVVAGDVVITMDADLQDSPDEIPGLYHLIKDDGYDLISGWKQKRHDPFSKTFPSKFFNKATSIVSGIKLHDFNCGLKAYKIDVVKSLEIHGEMHRYIPVLSKMSGYKKIGEKIVQHQARKYGVTKFGLERFFNGFLDLLSLSFISKFGKRPMHFFGLLGSFMFFIGFIILVYLVIMKLAYSEFGMTDRPMFFLGLLTVMLGSQLFLTGYIAEMIARKTAGKNDYVIEKKI